MDVRFFLIVLFSAHALCVPEYVIKKLCNDVDPVHCSVHSVTVDPCSRSPLLCILKNDKSYSLNVDFTPRFSATSLRLGVFSDEKRTGSFDTAIKAPQEGCDLLYCPLHTEERRVFEFHFEMTKMSPGKFPVKVKLWNEEAPNEACCFTFNVKIKK